MRRQAALLAGPAVALLAACGSPANTPLAAYDTPDPPPECRAAVYRDPAVRQLIAAGTAEPIVAAQNQDKLAFAEAEAARKCMRDKGLMQGGVEPVKRNWYPF